jgi:hypothetical protein
MSTETYTTDEYQTLQQHRREVAGNEESATVADVTLRDSTATLTLSFEWADTTDQRTFDLTSERDVLALESLAESAGYDFDHLPYLEDERIGVTYLDGEWVPTATLPTAHDSDVFADSGRTVPSLTERATNWLDDRLDTVEAKDVVLGVIVFKKLLIASALVYLLIS